MLKDCPNCRTPNLFEGPILDRPVVGACIACGALSNESTASFEQRRSTALATLLRRSLQKAIDRREQLRGIGRASIQTEPNDEERYSLWTDYPGEAYDECEAGWAAQDEGDLEAAEQHLRRAAEQEESLAYQALGELELARGNAVEALHWITKADLANVYTGERAQLEELRALVRAKAEAGDAAAECEVASWYFDGHGVTADSMEAIEWLKNAASRGFAAAKYRLAVLIEEGKVPGGETHNPIALYLAAAEAACADAQYRLAQAYVKGDLVDRDERRARYWLERAAISDHLEAIFELAEAFGDTDDVAAEVPLLEKAAVRGHPRAQTLLSWRYQRGRGVAEDDAKALSWLRRGARQFDPWAEHSLGLRYRDGEGVAPSEVNALYWLRRAATHGEDEARLDLAQMLRRRGRAPSEVEEAVYWILRVAIDGEPFWRSSAQNQIGHLCERGDGVAQSDELAFRWYLKAAEGGNGEARERLSERFKQFARMIRQHPIAGCHGDANRGNQGHNTSMPIISTFFGIVVRMYYQEHEPGHFHAEYQGQAGTFDFSGQPLQGQIRSSTARRLIREWAEARSAQLEENWARMKRGQALDRIEPLE